MVPAFNIINAMPGKNKVGSFSTRERRFWAKVVKNDLGCWIWTGAKTNGYGQIDKTGAHRVSWEIHFGHVPSGLFVCHRCDVPLCVRPDHLFVGTATDNNHDKIRKGRDVKGVAVVTAKLNEETVSNIRSEYATGISQVVLSVRYDVGQPHISSIVRGLAWRGPGRGGRWFAPLGEP